MLDLLPIELYRVKRQVGSVSERVDLSHGDASVFLELMRTKKAQYRVLTVSEDDVT